MDDRQRLTALKALDLLQNIQKDDSDAETDIQSCEDVYDSREDNFNELESEFSSDNESLVSEPSNSDISDFADIETNSETDEDQDLQNNTTSLAASDETMWDLLDPVQNNSGRRSYHNICREAPGPSTQAKRSISKESVCSAWDLFIDESVLRHIQRCTEEARRVLQTVDWRVSLHELDAFLV